MVSQKAKEKKAETKNSVKVPTYIKSYPSLGFFVEQGLFVSSMFPMMYMLWG
jgi:hypothetical protein